MRPAALVKRSLIFAHRWLGVALSVLFLLWFASGIVMMYWTYPEVTAEDRIERLPLLEPEDIKVSPQAAVQALGRDQEPTPAQVRLTSFDSRPVYRFSVGGRGESRGGGWMMVYADDGRIADHVDDDVLDRAAAAWAGRPAREAARESIQDVDQWTVGSNLRSMRPLYKYSFPDGQQVYINGNTAEVVQYTTRSSRFWAYLGAIPHWLYFTPLRKHAPQWSATVVWSSLLGTITAIIGVVIAVWMLSPAKRYRHAGVPTSIPYRGWKRWHTIVGLIFGIVTTTWAFSGLLSMGPFPIIDRLTELTAPLPAPAAGEAGPRRGRGAGRGSNLGAALRGRVSPSLSEYDEKDPRTALASVRDFGAKELEFTSFAGAPVYLATNGAGDTRVIPLRGPPASSYPVDEVISIIRNAAGKNLAELRVLHQYDAYYLDRRREAPLPVIYAAMNDPLRTRYYIDPKTARVVATYSKRNWISRWLYHGLHSLDFPWLYNYRPLWDVVVITLMLGGTALCVTSIVLTWRVLAKKAAAAVRARFNSPNDDLIAEA